MIRDEKHRVIGKLIGINSEKFTVELLTHSINFTVNGFDDIHNFAQLNSYVVIPYQNNYIVAEIYGVRENDSTSKFKGEQEQTLNKVNSIKYLDVSPIGRVVNGEFKYGLSIFPSLYSDVLYIKKEELDIIFETRDDEYVIEGSKTALKKLSIGQSVVFHDYDVKIDVNGFFGGHSAILGNTGSGKSCTIASILQTLFKKQVFSSTGASFVFFDVNGEYKRAFESLENEDIEVNFMSLEGEGKEEFKLPHSFLTIEEWALLLQASEKTQLPILRKALGISSVINNADIGNEDYNKQLNYILATAIGQILRDDTGSPSKRDRITSILSKYKTSDICLTKSFSYYDNEGTEHTSISYENRGRKTISCTIENCLKVNFGGLIGIEQLLQYVEGRDENDDFKFMHPDVKIPNYEIDDFFTFETLDDGLDIAILHEEAYGNRQIRDYCSSLLTRFKSLKERPEFNFLRAEEEDNQISMYLDKILGIEREGEILRKKTQITIIDLNAIDDDVVEVISCVLTRMIFERLRTAEPRNSYPVNLILEEAHRYISVNKNNVFGEANKIFDRVAKEGRKYGVFLLISSQRPSELSRTVLSQCSNFIIHRIQNPEDLSQIKQMTPHVSGTILSRLPSIPRQFALVFGHSVQIPVLFKVNEASPLPLSIDNDVSANWFKPKEHEIKVKFK